MPRTDIRCFTLVELIVAIALLVVVSAVVAMTGLTFYNGYESSVKATSRLKEYMAIDNLMDNHVRNIVPFMWKDDDGTSRLLFNGEENELYFSTLRRSYGERPGALLFVRVFVEEGNLIAAYSPYPRLPWLEEDETTMPWTREVIAENVEEVTFSYAEYSTDVEGQIEFLETYLEEENTSLPLGIKMTVRWQDGRTEQWFRRVAGISANSSFGERTVSNSSSGTGTAQSGSGTAATASGGGRNGSSAPASGRNNSGGRNSGGSVPGRGGRAQ